MTRKAILLEAYAAGYSSRDAASIAGLRSGWAREVIKLAGLSRPVGRPRNSRRAQRER